MITSLLSFSINICRLLLHPFDGHLHPPYHFLSPFFSITCCLIGTWGIFLLGSPNLSPASFYLFHYRPSYVCLSLSHWCPFGYSLFISALIISVLFSYQYIFDFWWVVIYYFVYIGYNLILLTLWFSMSALCISSPTLYYLNILW